MVVLYTEPKQMLRGLGLPESPPSSGTRGTKYTQNRKVLSSEMLRKGITREGKEAARGCRNRVE